MHVERARRTPAQDLRQGAQQNVVGLAADALPDGTPPSAAHAPPSALGGTMIFAEARGLVKPETVWHVAPALTVPICFVHVPSTKIATEPPAHVPPPSIGSHEHFEHEWSSVTAP
jgi:hypothetical protein